MTQPEHTFPTLRRWRAMSEREQDALLDKIETRRRWRGFATRAAIALVGTAAAVTIIALAAALLLSH
jgi:CHASE3 domain sensor protein